MIDIYRNTLSMSTILSDGHPAAQNPVSQICDRKLNALTMSWHATLKSEIEKLRKQVYLLTTIMFQYSHVRENF